MEYDPTEVLRNDWQYTEGVTTAGIEYGPQTYVTGKATAPADNVRVRKGNPTQNQIAVAASTFGYAVTDQIFTIWSHTLREDPLDPDSERVYLVQGDFIVHAGKRWRVEWVKATIYDTQYVAYCKLSVTTPDEGISA